MSSKVKVGAAIVGLIGIAALAATMNTDKGSKYLKAAQAPQQAENYEDKEPQSHSSPISKGKNEETSTQESSQAEKASAHTQAQPDKVASDVEKEDKKAPETPERPITLGAVDKHFSERFLDTLTLVDKQDALINAKLDAEIRKAQGEGELGLNQAVPVATATTNTEAKKPEFTPIYVDRTYFDGDKPWAEMDLFMTGDMTQLYPAWEGTRYRNVEIIKIEKAGVWLSESGKKRFIRTGETE
ncbi:hypothetical protein [Vibrio sp. 10N.261.46.A3]|uniref:hypothetical protein n=1 Tax=Vibrio sp. 10N.261.46.A3 TaxID=3229658 RepID=UPI003551517E